MIVSTARRSAIVRGEAASSAETEELEVEELEAGCFPFSVMVIRGDMNLSKERK